MARKGVRYAPVKQPCSGFLSLLPRWEGRAGWPGGLCSVMEQMYGFHKREYSSLPFSAEFFCRRGSQLGRMVRRGKLPRGKRWRYRGRWDWRQMHCAAPPNGACCGGRCTALRWLMHRCALMVRKSIRVPDDAAGIVSWPVLPSARVLLARTSIPFCISNSTPAKCQQALSVTFRSSR